MKLKDLALVICKANKIEVRHLTGNFSIIFNNDDELWNHQILNVGDRCTYIDVKDSVILDLIIYSPTKDKWLVKDEWHQFEVSPDRLIKVSEVD